MKPTRAQRRALIFLANTGGWLCEDPVPIYPNTLRALEVRGWARLTTSIAGQITSAEPTKLGVAAARWGAAHVIADQAA